jgi:anaerobic selenocysteine-containing dehydrogenase
VPLTTRYRKYADTGFATPSRRVELYSATLSAHGYSPLPTFEEPLTSPRSRPDLADRYPLVLSCAKSLFFCETQHRQVAALRKSAPEPQVEIHPSTAAARGISTGDRVSLGTPYGSVRARAKFNANLDPEVVFGQHGWWEACDELGLPGYPPYGPDMRTSTLCSARRRATRSAGVRHYELRSATSRCSVLTRESRDVDRGHDWSRTPRHSSQWS